MTLVPADIPTWVLGCVFFWLFGCTWVGWRRGVIRQLVAIFALGGACVAAFILGPMLAPMVPPLGFPVFVRPLVAGIVIGISVWCVTLLLGAILFKKTEQQSFGLIRFVYGSLGAAFGLFFGIAVLTLAAWGIRLGGSFAEGIQRSSTVKNRSIYKPEPGAVLSLKHVLDRTSLSSVLAKIDPLPGTLYPQLEKAGQILGSPDSLERLLALPEMEPITRHPKLIALREDSQVQASIKAGDIFALLRNPKVRAAANDTQLMTALNRINLEHQVDVALGSKENKEKPHPSR